MILYKMTHFFYKVLHIETNVVPIFNMNHTISQNVLIVILIWKISNNIIENKYSKIQVIENKIMILKWDHVSLIWSIQMNDNLCKKWGCHLIWDRGSNNITSSVLC